METKERKERAILVGIDFAKSDYRIEASMQELANLVDAAGAEVMAMTTQARERRDSATYIGSGKVAEVAALVEAYEADMVVFNGELSGSQTRNLEALIGVKIVDRTNLILDIFAGRANTKEGMLQVQLAQLKYRLPRLVGYSDYLSRQGGGIGTRGPGEQKLETDKRHIQRNITHIQNELEKVVGHRETTRKQRLKSSLPIIALVGYTNAGKSTIMNGILTHSGETKTVEAKDMLFATLDTTLRRARLNNNQSILLTDTVGFVSNLPHALVAAFKSTLEEIRFADVILHVVDASNPDLDIQMDTTEAIMRDLEVLNKPIITVYNKVDLATEVDYPVGYTMSNRVYMSAHNPEDIDLLIDLIEDALADKFKKASVFLKFEDLGILDYFASTYDIGDIEYDEKGAHFKVVLTQEDYERFAEYIVK
ncbi:GTPase HflX [Erysipelothrix anatis]|uniref:GTPase HflX n=1 Tax=Erysipelothrix anatis TaxID=2683713 RepID=UPI001F3D6CD5|nr:GTPase HflX [Erysipelothrix anatis]